MGTLLKEYVESGEDYAKRLVCESSQQPLFKIRVDQIDFVNKFFKITFWDQMGEEIPPSHFCVGGLYSIFEYSPTNLFKQNEICLYIGISENDVYDRVRRFMKGLIGILREDESHSAASRAKESGINFHDIAFKYIPKKDFPEKKTPKRITFDDKYIDEYVVPIVNPKFNKTKRF